jgi:hypothetical protein
VKCRTVLLFGNESGWRKASGGDVKRGLREDGGKEEELFLWLERKASGGDVKGFKGNCFFGKRRRGEEKRRRGEEEKKGRGEEGKRGRGAQGKRGRGEKPWRVEELKRVQDLPNKGIISKRAKTMTGTWLSVSPPHKNKQLRTINMLPKINSNVDS